MGGHGDYAAGIPDTITPWFYISAVPAYGLRTCNYLLRRRARHYHLPVLGVCLTRLRYLPNYAYKRFARSCPTYLPNAACHLTYRDDDTR